MAKIIYKQKGLFGDTIYMDENYRMIGSSRKGLFGEEIFLDRNMKYAGSRQKSLFGEDVYLDKDYHVRGYGRKGLGDTRIYVDKDWRYAGWGGKGLGDEEIIFMDDNRSGSREPVTRRGTNWRMDLLGNYPGVDCLACGVNYEFKIEVFREKGVPVSGI